MAIPKEFAIISLEDAKRYAGVTGTCDDQLIDELVQQASTMINSYLGYNVISQTYREYQSSSDGPNIWLENIPISSVDLVSVGRDCPITINYTAGDASRASVEVTTTLLRLRSRVSGVITTTELVLADNATMSALETNIETVTGWTATVTDSFETYSPIELILHPAISAKNREAQLEIPSENQVPFELFSKTGRLFATCGWYYDYHIGRGYNSYGGSGYGDNGYSLYNKPNPHYYGQNDIVIEYTAGYDRSAVPYDLKSACLELSKFLYDNVQHDSTFKKEKIGDYEYELANLAQPLFSENSNANLGTKLNSYRRMVIKGA